MMFRVLVIDDEEPIRKLLTTVLEMDDFSIATANSATEGIEKLRHENFDLVMTDLRMETPFAGFEVVKFARHLNPSPLSVILTAFPVPPSDWKQAGADALFTKGGDTLNLGNRLHNLLKDKKSSTPSVPSSRSVM
jgi:CheY-like chemotaxis protein